MAGFWIVAAVALGLSVPVVGLIFGFMEPEDDGWPPAKHPKKGAR